MRSPASNTRGEHASFVSVVMMPNASAPHARGTRLWPEPSAGHARVQSTASAPHARGTLFLQPPVTSATFRVLLSHRHATLVHSGYFKQAAAEGSGCTEALG